MNLNYQTHLPIYQKRESIIDAIKDNQVVIIAGETGSGKTTQVPLFCLEAGLGVSGRIICTQPRRIAAISLANYTASGCNTVPGETIGFKVRFKSNVNESTKIIFATDGILLAEIPDDPYLSKYNTIIIDEAHERSVNIDFLIGHLRSIIPERTDLKIIISSATIDTRLFSRAFNNAPVITVSGRLFPVEIIYRPAIELWKGESMDSYLEGALTAVKEILDNNEQGDILIFLPAIADINDLQNRLLTLISDNTVILPLHSRLTIMQQQLIFKKIRKRKIVIATNIAETSLTVPGIRFVIDSGLVRMERYEPQAQLTRMPVEKISRASADQRAGRSGRVQDGVCIRLFSEADYLSRKNFTTPEIQRSNLAAVFLKLSYNGLGDPEKFLFLQRPSRLAIHSALRQLQELGAINRKCLITESGKDIARLPLDPPLAAMLIYARDHDAAREIMVIAAGLAAGDPFIELKNDSRKKMNHKIMESDFMRLLNIWKSCRAALRDSKNQSKCLCEYCKDHGLSSVKMREWSDTYHQIRRICRTIKGFNKKRTHPAYYESIHKSLLSGFYSGIACSSGKDIYNGINVDNILIHPSSVLSGKSPKWVLFHEIVETSRIYGKNAAVIKPEWVEEMFRVRCNYMYQETWYDHERGVVRAREEVTFKGLQLLTNRHIDLERKDPARAHEVFIREALVNEQIGSHYKFIRHNREIKDHISILQNKFRRAFYIGDWVLIDFYSKELPDVLNRRQLNERIRLCGNDKFLMIGIDELMAVDSRPDEQIYPDVIFIGKEKCSVSYLFSPDDDNDGMVVTVSEELYEAVPQYYWEWLIRAFWKPRLELILKEYSNQLRELSLTSDTVIDEICKEATSVLGTFVNCICSLLYEKYRLHISSMSIDMSIQPRNLWPVICVVDKNNNVLKKFRAGMEPFRKENSRAEIRDKFWEMECIEYEQAEFISWDTPFLECINIKSASQQIGLAGFAALHCEKDKIAVRIFFSRESASFSHISGIKKILEQRFEELLCWEVENVNISNVMKRKIFEIWPDTDIEECIKKMILKKFLYIHTDIPVTEIAFENLFELKKASAAEMQSGIINMVEIVISEYLRCLAILKKKRIKYEKTYLDEMYNNLYDALVNYIDEFIASDTSAIVMEKMPEVLSVFVNRIEYAYSDPLKYKSKMKLYKFYINCIEQLTKMEHGYEDWCKINEFRIFIEQFIISQLSPSGTKNQKNINQNDCQEMYDDLYRSLNIKGY